MSFEYGKDPAAEAAGEYARGQMGIFTGSASNQVGFYNRPTQPTGLISDPISPPVGRSSGEANGFLGILLFIAALAGISLLYKATNSWWVVGSVVLGLIGLTVGAVKFFQTRTGKVVRDVLMWTTILGILFWFAWFIHHEEGPEGFKILIIVYALSAAILLASAFFTKTTIGMKAARIISLWTRRLMMTATFLVAGYGLWILLSGSF